MPGKGASCQRLGGCRKYKLSKADKMHFIHPTKCCHTEKDRLVRVKVKVKAHDSDLKAIFIQGTHESSILW